MNMNEAQMHMLFNHLPVFGVIFCTLLLLYGLIRKSDELKKTALGALVVVALLTIPAYLTGEPAEHIVEHQAGVSEAAIHDHEEMAELTIWPMFVLGALSLSGLTILRKRQAFLMPLIFAGCLVISGMMAYTAHLGGLVNHPELRGEAQTGEHRED